MLHDNATPPFFLLLFLFAGSIFFCFSSSHSQFPPSFLPKISHITQLLVRLNNSSLLIFVSFSSFFPFPSSTLTRTSNSKSTTFTYYKIIRGVYVYRYIIFPLSMRDHPTITLDRLLSICILSKQSPVITFGFVIGNETNSNAKLNIFHFIKYLSKR